MTFLLTLLVLSQTTNAVIQNPTNPTKRVTTTTSGAKELLDVNVVLGGGGSSSGGGDGGYTVVIQGPGADGGAAWGVTGTVTANTAFATRSDTFGAAGNGTTVVATSTPYKAFSVQVKGTGAAPTSWDVRLEGSLDNSNFTAILTHTTTTGDGVVLYSGAALAPSLYVRSRCAAVTLGGASNIVVTILGTQ